MSVVAADEVVAVEPISRESLGAFTADATTVAGNFRVSSPGVLLPPPLPLPPLLLLEVAVPCPVADLSISTRSLSFSFSFSFFKARDGLAATTVTGLIRPPRPPRTV